VPLIPLFEAKLSHSPATNTLFACFFDKKPCITALSFYCANLIPFFINREQIELSVTSSQTEKQTEKVATEAKGGDNERLYGH